MSKKYVIEMKSEYEDTIRGIMVLGARDSNLYMDALAVEDMEELNSDYINEHFGDLQDTAYKKGLHDGESKCGYCTEYQRGLEDAQEAARKIIRMSDGDILDLFPDCYASVCTAAQVILKYDVSEAIAKLKAYEEKKADDDIKVGDEVTHKSDSVVWKAVCIQIDGDRRHMNLMGHTGAVGYYHVDDFKKTGRHFDIDKILEDMRK